MAHIGKPKRVIIVVPEPERYDAPSQTPEKMPQEPTRLPEPEPQHLPETEKEKVHA